MDARRDRPVTGRVRPDQQAWAPRTGPDHSGRRFVLRDLAQLAPDLADLVAKAGRVLEAEVLGGREHLLLELDDRLLHLRERQLALLAGAAALGAALALRGLAL